MSSARRLANPYVKEQPTQLTSTLTCDFLPRSRKNESDEINAIAFNNSGTYLAAGTALGRLVIYDMATQSPALIVHQLHTSDINSVAWVPHGRGRVVCTSSDDGRVHFFHLESRTIQGVLELSGVEKIAGALPSPRQFGLVLVSPVIPSPQLKEPAKILWPAAYRLGDLCCVCTFKPASARQVDPGMIDKSVVAQYDASGSMVFVGAVGSVSVFAAQTGVEFFTVAIPSNLSARGATGWIVGMNLSRNGRLLSVDQGQERIFMFAVRDLRADHVAATNVEQLLRQRVQTPLTYKHDHFDPVNKSTKWGDIACSPSGDYVAAMSLSKEVQEIFIFYEQFSDLLKDSGKGTITNTNRQCVWHPWRPLLATVYGGQISLWSSTPLQSDDGIDSAQLAFAPGFTLLVHENIEVGDVPNETENQTAKRLCRPSEASDPIQLEGHSCNEGFADEDDDHDALHKGIGYFIPATLPSIEVRLG